MHYSLRTEEAYVYWVRGFIRWAGLRHPRDLGAGEVQDFLVMLANERRVAAATHRQALSALLFLYREVLGVDMPWLRELGRPVPQKRIPVVLTHVEVQALLARMGEGVTGLLGRLLYGTGMRLLEGVRLRVKDVDFVRQVIVVRDGRAARTASSCCRAPSTAPCACSFRRRAGSGFRPRAAAGRRLPAPRPRRQVQARRRELGLVLALPRGYAEQRTRAAAHRGCIAITSTKSTCSATSVPRCGRRASPSRRLCTPCAIRSPPTCWRPAPTSAPCSSCSATPTSARP